MHTMMRNSLESEEEKKTNHSLNDNVNETIGRAHSIVKMIRNFLANVRSKPQNRRIHAVREKIDIEK